MFVTVRDAVNHATEDLTSQAQVRCHLLQLFLESWLLERQGQHLIIVGAIRPEGAATPWTCTQQVVVFITAAFSVFTS
jgi:hypothetical protein